MFHRKNEVLRQGTGLAIAGASITVYVNGTDVGGNYAVATKAQLYSTNDTSQPVANPLTSDVNGEYRYFIDDGVYDEVLEYGSLREVEAYIQMYDPSVVGTVEEDVPVAVAVTQLTSKATAVQADARAGEITLAATSLAAGASTSFRLNNLLLEDGDRLEAFIIGGAVDPTAYTIAATKVADGARQIWIRNVSGGALAEALIIGFEIFEIVAPTVIAPDPIPTGPDPEPSVPVQYLWTGVPTDVGVKTTAKLTGAAASIRMAVSTSPLLTTPVYGAGVAPDGTYRIAQLSIAGLTPGTQYYYGIEVDGLIDHAHVGKFKTAGSAAQNFSFAFGSCSLPGRTDSFDKIIEKAPGFFIHTGDFQYDDLYTAKGGALAEADYQASFNNVFAERGYFHANVPNAYIYNDHDFLTNDTTGKDASNADLALRPVPIAAFRRRVPASFGSATGTAACYQSFVYGRVRFIILDVYADSSPDSLTDNATKSKLGATQKTWLKAQIDAAATASQFVCLVSGDPFCADELESWDKYRTERTELADYFATAGMAGKIFVLGGGQHSLAYGSADYTTTRGAVQPCFQAAPLYNSRSNYGGPWDAPVFTPAGTPGLQKLFGWVDVVDDGTNLTVTYTGFDSSGAVMMGPVSLNMNARKVAPDYYAQAAHTGLASATTCSPAKPAIGGIDGLLVAVLATKNNNVHSCSTSGWTKVSQVNSGTGFTVSTWVAPEATAAPTFTWPTASAAYARILGYASPSGSVRMVSGSASASGGSGTPINVTMTPSTAQDVLHLAMAISNEQNDVATNYWEKFLDIGSSTAGVELTAAGRRYAAYPAAPENINWTNGTTLEWVLSQLHLQVI